MRQAFAQDGPLRTRAAALGFGVALAGAPGCALLGGEGEVPEDLLPEVRADLSVDVTDAATGAPIPGARVVLTPGGRDALAGEDGRATFLALRDGEYTVRAVAAGYVRAEAPAAVAGLTTAVGVALGAEQPDLARARGRVLGPGPDPVPVAGASVAVDGEVVATTDADGTYVTSGVEPGYRRIEVLPPGGSPFRPYASGALELVAGSAAFFAPTLPGASPAGSGYVGSAACAECHPAEATLHEASAHGRAGRVPAEVEAEGTSGLAAAFAAGDTVPLGPDPDGARLELGRTGPGSWWIEVWGADGSGSGPLAVREVYGGDLWGAALAVEAGGVWALAPAAWALAGLGEPEAAEPAGWVAAWTGGWFDAAGDLDIPGGAPGPEASFDLQCAGCHASDPALDETAPGRFELAGLLGGEPERTVGCEACHGPGAAHADDERPETVFDPSRVPARDALLTCARCHERTEATAHPFSSAPGWPLGPEGDGVLPWEDLAAVADAAPEDWLTAPASRLHRDQVGEFRTSPHRQGEDGFLGDCSACHDPHGSAFRAGLLRDPDDNGTCTTCHAALFPDADAESAHVRHRRFAPGPLAPGACASCHLPRSGLALRPDAASGAGEAHAHGLRPWSPAESLSEFDAAGAETLPLGEAPIAPCLDCHRRAQAAAEAAGSACACPAPDPTLRQSHADLAVIFEDLFGGPP